MQNKNDNDNILLLDKNVIRNNVLLRNDHGKSWDVVNENSNDVLYKSGLVSLSQYNTEIENIIFLYIYHYNS